MKRIAGLFLIAVAAGALTLGAYKMFFEPEYPAMYESEDGLSVFTTSTMPTYPAGAKIDAVDFTTAAENTVNAVVHVKNVTVNRSPRSRSEFFYGYDQRQRPQVGTGSGVIISPDGYIVTNNHVIARATELSVSLNNNRTYEAVVVGTDPITDIALLKIEAEDLPHLAFGDSDNLKIGEWVLAVGNPFDLTSTVTAGIVSAKARDLGRNQSFIQTDAAVNPGNSGGALVNTNGDLVGINTAITSQTGSYIGYAFAVPSNIARKVVEDLLEYGDVQVGILGIQTPKLNTAYAKENGFDEIDGLYIDGIEEDSGAEEAGLQRGDIIRKIDDIRIRKFADLIGYVTTKRPGVMVTVWVDRDGEELEIPVEIRERITASLPWLGVKVKNLSAKDKEQFGIDNGVKIIGVPEMFRGYDLNGKIILSVDNEPINDIEDAQRLFSRISKYQNSSITLLNKEGEKERLIFQ